MGGRGGGRDYPCAMTTDDHNAMTIRLRRHQCQRPGMQDPHMVSGVVRGLSNGSSFAGSYSRACLSLTKLLVYHI